MTVRVCAASNVDGRIPGSAAPPWPRAGTRWWRSWPGTRGGRAGGRSRRLPSPGPPRAPPREAAPACAVRARRRAPAAHCGWTASPRAAWPARARRRAGAVARARLHRAFVFQARNSGAVGGEQQPGEDADERRVPSSTPGAGARRTGPWRSSRSRRWARRGSRCPARRRARPRAATLANANVVSQKRVQSGSRGGERNSIDEPAQDQQPEHHHQRQVEAGEPTAYARGKAKKSVPPAASSQTSLPSQNGPIRREHLAPLVVGARDEAVQEAGAEIEAVEHTYVASITATGSVPELCHRRPPSAARPAAALRSRAHEVEEEHAEHEVQPAEAEQGEHHVARRDARRGPAAVRSSP